MIDEKKLIEEIRKDQKGLMLESEKERFAYDVLEHVIEIVNEQLKTDWIPCEVELPKENTEVWVTVEELDGGCYTQASWLQDGQWVIKKTPLEPKVIAWMYKLQPYKKEGAENDS